MRSLFLVLLALALVPAHAGAAQPTGQTSTAKRISGHIQESGQLRNYRIGVTYKNGLATLNGTVTNEQQKEAAIQLAKEVQGVKRVECKLECTDDGALTAENQPGQSLTNERGLQTPDAGSNAITASFQGERSDVMQAFGQEGMPAPPVPPQTAPQQFQQLPQRQLQPQAMMPRGNMPMNRARMPRNNMPLGAPRPMMDPNLRRASAEGCYQAGGPYAEGYATMGPGGPAGMGPMQGGPMQGGPMPTGVVPTSYGRGPSYENAQMPGYAWPSYASYPNYAALSYPQQYSPTAWPYIGPFYPYPQVPLAWRKVSLEWDDGWWFLDFSAHNSSH
jgi:hypothetical protein